MTTCDEFELQVEMRLRGALPATDALVDHLASCASCRAFEALARGTKKTMNATVHAEAQQVDWQALRDGISTRIARDARWHFGAVIGVLSAQAVAILAFNKAAHWAHIFPNFALIVFATLAVLAGLVIVRRRRMRAYESSREDLLFFHRAYVEGRLWRTWIGSILLAPLGAAYLVVRFVRHSPVAPTEWLAAGMMSTLILGLAAWLFFVQRPRLERELDAFKRK
jgi:hypothetical protein